MSTFDKARGYGLFEDAFMDAVENNDIYEETLEEALKNFSGINWGEVVEALEDENEDSDTIKYALEAVERAAARASSRSEVDDVLSQAFLGVYDLMVDEATRAYGVESDAVEVWADVDVSALLNELMEEFSDQLLIDRAFVWDGAESFSLDGDAEGAVYDYVREGLGEELLLAAKSERRELVLEEHDYALSVLEEHLDEEVQRRVEGGEGMDINLHDLEKIYDAQVEYGPLYDGTENYIGDREGDMRDLAEGFGFTVR